MDFWALLGLGLALFLIIYGEDILAIILGLLIVRAERKKHQQRKADGDA